MNVEMESDEMGVLMLVQQYASKFGVTFSSHWMDDPEKKAKLMQLMALAIGGQRGPITDDDLA